MRFNSLWNSRVFSRITVSLSLQPRCGSVICVYLNADSNLLTPSVVDNTICIDYLVVNVLVNIFTGGAVAFLQLNAYRKEIYPVINQANSESTRLANIAADSRYSFWVNENTIGHSFDVFKRFIESGPTLELGPAEGYMTNKLVSLNLPLTCVDGAAAFCENLQRTYPQIEVVHSLFEDFRPTKKYVNIILGHVLEHVENPVQILNLVKDWLTENGRIMAAVPNARSLHRQAAVVMGILNTEDQLNEADLHDGHRRVYNPESFRYDFRAAGLAVETFGGYWLKPLSNSQIDRDWSPHLLEAFMTLGERYPDIAGEIYVIARPM